MRIRYQISVIAAVLWLSACNVIPEPEQTRVYPLPQVLAPMQLDTYAGTLRVAQPSALQALDLPRVAVIQSDGRQAYWQGLRLQDRLPLVVQDALVRGMQDSQIATHVVRDSSASAFHVELQTHIEQFAIINASSPQARSAAVVIRAQLRRANDRQVIATQRFEAQYEGLGSGEAAALAGLAEALAMVQRDMMMWANLALQDK